MTLQLRCDDVNTRIMIIKYRFGLKLILRKNLTINKHHSRNSLLLLHDNLVVCSE